MCAIEYNVICIRGILILATTYGSKIYGISMPRVNVINKVINKGVGTSCVEKTFKE